MNRPIRSAAIRTSLQEMTESIDMVRECLPDSADAFTRLGIVRDGIYKRMEYAIENVFDICAMLNTDLHLGVPGTDEDIVDHLIRHGVVSQEMLNSLKAMKGFRNIVVQSLRSDRRCSHLCDPAGAYRRFRSVQAGDRGFLERKGFGLKIKGPSTFRKIDEYISQQRDRGGRSLMMWGMHFEREMRTGILSLKMTARATRSLRESDPPALRLQGDARRAAASEDARESEIDLFAETECGREYCVSSG